jgi:chorismate dehydratase
VRAEALAHCGMTREELIADLDNSRQAGLAHIDEIVAEWQPRLPLTAETIRHYLTENIHYALDTACVDAIDRFYTLADQAGVLPGYKFRLL